LSVPAAYIIVTGIFGAGTTNLPPGVHEYPYPMPSSVALTATAFSGWHFSHWIINGQTFTDNPHSVSLSPGIVYQVQAYFEENTVATTLTFTANKTVVIPSEPITFSGRLTRNDTAAGVAGEPLDLQIYNYGAWATVWTVPATDSNGNFSFSRNAETSSGTWRYRMVYAGNA